MTHRRINRRVAFTLLEVLLAMAIGVLLLAGLYVALSSQLRHAQIGRDLIEQGTLARSLLSRMTNDISSHLGPLNPPPARQQSGAQSASATAQPADSSAATTSTAGAGASTAADSGDAAAAGLSGPVTINLGVQGDETTLVLYVSRVPRDLNLLTAQMADLVNPNVSSDHRRITYWLAGGADAPSGLARQEVQLVTSDELLDSLTPDVADPSALIIAEEVRGLSFRYWDGTTWQTTWDGSAPGADGVKPVGPPLAIEIILDVAPPGAAGRSEVATKRYRHVVGIATANGPVPLQTGDPAAATTGQ